MNLRDNILVAVLFVGLMTFFLVDSKGKLTNALESNTLLKERIATLESTALIPLEANVKEVVQMDTGTIDSLRQEIRLRDERISTLNKAVKGSVLTINRLYALVDEIVGFMNSPSSDDSVFQFILHNLIPDEPGFMTQEIIDLKRKQALQFSFKFPYLLCMSIRNNFINNGPIERELPNCIQAIDFVKYSKF